MYKHSRMIMLFIVLIMIFIMQSVHVTAKTEGESLVYDGEDYFVELKFGKEAGIPENAELRVVEICEGTKEFQQYLSKTVSYVKKDNETEVTFARFYDVSIVDGEKKIEPDESVEVTIGYKDGIPKEESNDISIIHFIEDGEKELLRVQEEEKSNLVTQIFFEQESFSVIGMIVLDGVNAEIKSSSSEVITEIDAIQVKKEWSDGQDLHKTDAVKVSLYQHTDEKTEKVNEITLSESNNWTGRFRNLDKTSKYSIKEEQIISENMDVKTSYKSVITNEYVKKWCNSDDNSLIDGNKVLLFLDNNTKALRKSADYEQMNLRIYDVEVTSSFTYGEYCTTEVTNNCVWISKWNNEKNAWTLYNEEGNAYLSLIYNADTEVYEWATSREIAEGSYLTFTNGMFSATVNGVTKYLGNVSGKGPYEGVDRWDSSITKIKAFSYKVFSPVVCNIYNEKNETTKEHETNVDVIAKKTIDYLGDGEDNPDTDGDNGILSDKILRDLYRLDLNVQMQTDVTGLDLLMVIDVSSSMEDIEDAKDDEGNNIKRSEALRQALNIFVPEFLPVDTKNRISLVAFESESMILQDWTDSAKEVLDKVNYEVDGQMPLYSGSGTNYEAALARAHEALAMRGYSNNAKAMLFLSDGDPTVYIEGNDELEKGNVSFNMGKANLSAQGIDCIYPEDVKPVWGMEDGKAIAAADEAIASFHNHNPEIMVGTVAFNTRLTNSIKNMATDPGFVTKIENGSPTDLINAMELITEYVPKEIIITDELSENVELYNEYPDILVTECDESDKQTVLFSTKEGLTDAGKKALNNEKPVEVNNKKVILRFGSEYNVKNQYTYHLSFNVNVSQSAMNKYADQKGIYPDTGDEDTDYEGNKTSSLKKGFYSNADATGVTYSLSGAKMTKKYRKPVVQVREGTLTVLKTDPLGNVITTGAAFDLYRKADEGESEAVTVDGIDELCVKIAEGVTDSEGKLIFEHLRLAVFDEGYPYYLVETEAPEGFTRIEKPIEVLLTEEGEITVKNGNYIMDGESVLEIPVTGGKGIMVYLLVGIVLITGGILMKKRKLFSGFVKMFALVLAAVQLFSMTAFAIEKEEKGNITVNGVESKVTVNVYQMMDVKYDFEVNQPQNPMYQWRTEVAGWVNENYPEYIDAKNENEVKEEFSSATDKTVAELYDKLAVAIKAGKVNLPKTSVTASSETATISDLVMGNYFILVEGGVKVYRPMTANVVPEWKETKWAMTAPVVEAKSSEPVITKTMEGGLKKDNLNIGDTISYEITAIVPDYPVNALAKKFVISDNLSSGLTLVEDSLKVYGMNSGMDPALLTGGYAKKTQRPSTVVNDNNVTFSYDFTYESIRSYSSIKITYDTILNKDAVIESAGNVNTAYLDYNNNPYVESSWKTDEEDVVVYTYGLKVLKVDVDTGKGLAGAQFSLSKDGKEIVFAGSDGDYHVAKEGESGSTIVTVSSTGNLILKGLDASEYVLTEEKAPDGYVKLQNPVNIEIEDKDMNGKVEYDNKELEGGYISLTVENDKGFTLPITGGMGSTIFYIAGMALMCTGGVLIAAYLRKKK